MRFTLYTCRNDAFLLVPEITEPPRDAENAYGPLLRGKIIDSDDHSLVDAWETILDAVDAHGFAVLHPVVVRHLLGLDPEPQMATILSR